MRVSSLILHPQTIALFVLFFSLRLLSFALVGYPTIQAFLVLCIIILFGIVSFVDIRYGWFMLLGELFLGGAGHFLEFFGLSLRTTLFITFFCVWLAHTEHRKHLTIRHPLFYGMGILAIVTILAGSIGMIHGHGIRHVMADLIPYSYYLLILPFFQTLKDTRVQTYLLRVLFVFFLGSAICSLITFIIYTTDLGVIHDSYYRWFRDVSMGKITDMGQGFFRIVTPEHMLIVPGILILSSLLMGKKIQRNIGYALLGIGLLTLMLDLSRTYLLALGIGFIVLLFAHKRKEWFTVSISATGIFFILFVMTNLLSSNATSTGLGLLGLRFASIATPTLETSAYTRMALLPPILEQIQKHPLLGSGLGSTITFLPPDTAAPVTTTQFDWGYLELLTELGALGLVVYISILGYTVYALGKNIQEEQKTREISLGLLAGVISFLAMAITSPVLSHVFGVTYLSIVIAFAIQPKNLFGRVTEHISSLFSRI